MDRRHQVSLNTDKADTFHLNPGLNCRILIHDPKLYYLPVVKSGIFPQIRGGGLQLPVVREIQPGEVGGLSTSRKI